MLTSADIRDRLRKSPFVPFRIVTSSGESYSVFHPEFAIVGKRWVAVGIPAVPEDRDVDRLQTISMLHIAALEDLPSQATA
jgi:hypothetical protein